ncbi:MAG: hypothetical protein ACE5I1_04265 [bacterium]
MKKRDSLRAFSATTTLLIYALLFLLLIGVRLPEAVAPKVEKPAIIIDQEIPLAAILNQQPPAEEEANAPPGANEQDAEPERPPAEPQPVEQKLDFDALFSSKPELHSPVRQVDLQKNRTSEIKMNLPENKPLDFTEKIQRSAELFTKAKKTVRAVMLSPKRKNRRKDPQQRVGIANTHTDDEEAGMGKKKWGMDKVSRKGPHKKQQAGLPVVSVAEPPAAGRATVELKEIIRWIVANPKTIPGFVEKALEKKSDDVASQVKFVFADQTYTIFLRATPVSGKEELAYAICHKDSVGLMIDVGADQKDDLLRIGTAFSDNDTLRSFKSNFKEIEYKRTGKYSVILWSWWGYQKKKR